MCKFTNRKIKIELKTELKNKNKLNYLRKERFEVPSSSFDATEGV